MKRTISTITLSAASPIVRSQEHGPICFELYHPTLAIAFRLQKVGTSTESVDSEGVDAVDYILRFVEDVPWEVARNIYVRILYTGKKRMRSGKILFGNSLCPTADAGKRRVLRERELEYICYKTHQIQVTPPTPDRVVAMHIRILNATVDVGGPFELALEIHSNDLNPPRMHGLEWFPPDVDPLYWGLRVDPRLIQQRTPLWFHYRGGQVSGTKAYQLMGYYLRETDKVPYTLDGDGTFTQEQKARMRLGSLSEGAAALCYLDAYPQRELHETGWCPAPAGYPIGYGASPDARVWDPTSITPAAEYPELDPRRGTLEIKTSRRKTRMEPYFIPQCYMEMIATETAWLDLVRFVPQRYGTENCDVAHVYRIYRERRVETLLMGLWKRALTNVSILPSVVKEEAFVNARAEFQRMADDLTAHPTLVTGAEHSPTYRAEIARFEGVRREALRPRTYRECALEEGIDENALAWTHLEEVSEEMLRASKRHAPLPELSRLIASQLSALCQFK